MRKRDKVIKIRFTLAELNQLNESVAKTGLPREVYIRQVLAGKTPKVLPDKDYFTVIQELRHIGVNMNQIALKANSSNVINASAYWSCYRNLEKIIGDLVRGGYE